MKSDRKDGPVYKCWVGLRLIFAAQSAVRWGGIQGPNIIQGYVWAPVVCDRLEQRLQTCNFSYVFTYIPTIPSVHRTTDYISI